MTRFARCLFAAVICLACGEKDAPGKSGSVPGPSALSSGVPELTFENEERPPRFVNVRDGLNLREGPALSFPVLATLPNGFAVQCRRISREWVVLNGHRGRWCDIGLELPAEEDFSYYMYNGHLFSFYLSDQPPEIPRPDPQTDAISFFVGHWHPLRGQRLDQEAVLSFFQKEALLSIKASLVVESVILNDLLPVCAEKHCVLQRNGQETIKVRILDSRTIQLYDGPVFEEVGSHHRVGEPMIEGTYLYNPPVRPR